MSDDQSKVSVKNADDAASKIEKLPKIRIVIRDKKRNVGSCSGATNSKTTDGGTNSKPNTISSAKKDVNEIVTESRPREIGIHGDGVPHSKGYGRSEFKSASSDSKPCVVENCERDGGFFHVCEGHMWSFGVSVNGKPSTYCHSCYLFQNVEDFDAGRHICKKATGTSKNDALAIPTRTGLKNLKYTSKEDLRGSKFKGDGLHENAHRDSKPCQVDNCNVEGGFYGACRSHRWSSDVSVKDKPMKFCQTCMMFQNISDFDPGSRICKSWATVEKEDAPECYPGSTDEALHSSKLLKLTEEMHSNISDMGTQLVRLAEDTERMQQDIEQTQQLVLKGNKKLREEVRTSNKRLREDIERRCANLQKSLGK